LLRLSFDEPGAWPVRAPSSPTRRRRNAHRERRGNDASRRHSHHAGRGA
jgi:hypothetical protein